MSELNEESEIVALVEAARLAPPMLAPSWHPLSHIDEYLLAKRWTFEEGKGWLPPLEFRDAIAMHLGRGHYARGIAIHLQVRWDETHPALVSVISQGKATRLN